MTSSFVHRPALAAGLCLFCACAARRPTAPPAPPPPPPPPVSYSLDGVYRGTTTRYRADRRTCPSPGLIHFEVAGGGFNYSLGSRGKVPVAIAPDGTLQGTDGDFLITGRATQTRITGHADSPACGYEFNAVRKR